MLDEPAGVVEIDDVDGVWEMGLRDGFDPLGAIAEGCGTRSIRNARTAPPQSDKRPYEKRQN